jgi:uncharacterized protein (DUF885 family)
MNAAAALADLAARYWQYERTESPFAAFLAGQAGDEAVLFRESCADYERRYGLAGQMLETLRAISTDALSQVDRATHRLLDRELSAIRAHYDVDAHLRPSLLPVGPDFNTVFYANSVAISDAHSAKLHVDRLAAFPAFLDDVRTCLATGYARGIRYPRIVLEAAVANTRGSATIAAETSPWYAPFRKSTAAENPDVQREAERALAIISDKLLPALAAYADYMAGPLTVGARDTIACTDAPKGAAYYAMLAQYFTTTDMTPEEIHTLGVSEVARIEAEMETLAAQAGFAGDVAGYRHFLATDPQFISPNAETLRERMEILCKRIDGRIPAFFSRIPRITYGVESMSAAQSVTMPPAYAQPATPGGSIAGLFWISGLPEKCPSYLHPALAVHEAWPGHLMHIALMAELDDLPAFRRYGAMKYTVCIEGWALYCEQLGIELGVYQTPHHHYGRLEMELWRACRLVVDTGIHIYNWSRVAAIDYMAARLTLSHDTIAAEVDRYAALPGQALAYQIGGLKVRALRKRAEEKLGDSFSLRSFHEVVITAGAVTLPVLEDIVDHWIAHAA